MREAWFFPCGIEPLVLDGYEYKEMEREEIERRTGLEVACGGAWCVLEKARHSDTWLNKRVKEEISRAGAPFLEVVHRPVKTSMEAAEARSSSLEQGVKCLVMDKGGEAVAVLLPASKMADMERLKGLGITGFYDIRRLGLTKGAVPPFGHGLKTYVDKEIFENEIVWFNSGLRTASIALRSEDLKELLHGAEEI